MLRMLRPIGLVVAGLLLFAACGDDGDSLPSEDEAVELLTEELQTSAGLSEEDAECASQEIIDEIGVAGLVEIGLAGGGSGDVEDLPEDQQAELFDLVTDAFESCDIAAN